MFSASVFTIEVDGVAQVAFESRKYGDADLICQHWASHSLQPRTTDTSGPVIKLRLARPEERAVYEQAQVTDRTEHTAFVPLTGRRETRD